MSPCQGLVEGSIPSGRTNQQAREVNTFRAFAVGSGQRESKDGGGIQDERSEGLSPSRGRERD
jgi:hypothetical protein